MVIRNSSPAVRNLIFKRIHPSQNAFSFKPADSISMCVSQCICCIQNKIVCYFVPLPRSMTCILCKFRFFNQPFLLFIIKKKNESKKNINSYVVGQSCGIISNVLRLTILQGLAQSLFFNYVHNGEFTCTYVNTSSFSHLTKRF